VGGEIWSEIWIGSGAVGGARMARWRSGRRRGRRPLGQLNKLKWTQLEWKRRRTNRSRLGRSQSWARLRASDRPSGQQSAQIGPNRSHFGDNLSLTPVRHRRRRHRLAKAATLGVARRPSGWRLSANGAPRGEARPAGTRSPRCPPLARPAAASLLSAHLSRAGPKQTSQGESCERQGRANKGRLLFAPNSAKFKLKRQHFWPKSVAQD